jgi:hypothetical protein
MGNTRPTDWDAGVVDSPAMEASQPLDSVHQSDAAGPAPPVSRRAPAVSGDRPRLDRQRPPRSVPEVRPTPLQRHYIGLSVVVLMGGTLAITLLEAGLPLAHPLVRVPILMAAPLLVATAADAMIRIWRSVHAWWPWDRGRALFRLTWLVPAALGVVGGLAAFLAAVRG